MLFVLFGLSLALAELVNPITRVAQLLQGLSDQLENDSKAEEKLYDDFVCWYKTIESQKTQSNELAARRIAELEAYIDDIANGRVEFTTERADLAREVEGLTNQLEQEKAARDQANKDFLAAQAEMNAAITALDNAIKVLADATEDSKEGVLLGVKFALRRAFVKSHYDNMRSDIERMIDDNLKKQPKDKDWEKLDGDKSTFSKGYKGRSFKLQKLLGDMNNTFKENLALAEKEEGHAVDDYNTLRDQKLLTLENRKKAASELNAENAKRDQTRAESEAERDQLKTQKENDEKTLAEVATTYATKKDEFKERKRLRTEEIASIAQAISILRSDDSRDLFKRSFDSQTPDFLQLSRCATKRNQKALHILANSGNERLRVLSLIFATKITNKDFPQNVLDKIDSIIADLQTEGTNDEKEKHDCEKYRAKNTNEAKDTSNSIDDNTEEIGRQNALVEKLTALIEQKNEQINKIKEDIKEANEQRDKEHNEYVKSDSDDKEAVKVIEKASDALKKFYEDNDLAALIQNKELTSRRLKAAPEIVAGEAPPPPPATWEDANYGGAKDMHQGVVAIMQLIKEDVEKDIRVATEEEKKAEAEHQAFLQESIGDGKIDVNGEFTGDVGGEIGALLEQINDATVKKSNAQDEIHSQETERSGSKTSLAETISGLETEEPKCNFISINFQNRKGNRAAELDGLEKAKAVLKGATFGFLEC